MVYEDLIGGISSASSGCFLSMSGVYDPTKYAEIDKSILVNMSVEDTWRQLTSGATARSEHTVISYNNGTDDIMIVFGGSDGSNNLNDTWEYNITTDTWTQLSSGATNRYGHSAITYNNGTDDIMIVFGGWNGNYLNDTWEYNITTDTWTQLSSGATGIRGHTAISYNNGTDDIMIVFGGYDGNSRLNDTWEYNITTDTWTQLTSGATARSEHTVISYNNGTDDIMIVFGGTDGSNRLNDTWEYNITTDTWTQLSSGATNRQQHSAITYNNGTDDIMIVFGGYDGSNDLNDTWEYNITTDTWRQLSSGATGIRGHTAISYNNGTDDIMIVFGGYDGSRLNDTWEYNIFNKLNNAKLLIPIKD